MGLLILLLILGIIPLGFLYLLIFDRRTLLNMFKALLGFLVVLATGAGVLFGLFYWAASGSA